MARPKIKIDWKLFDAFCAMQCTIREMANYFNCSVDTVENRVRQEKGIGFSDYYQKKRVGGLIALRRNMIRMSEINPAVAIFLAKNWLGMADKQEVTGAGGGAIKTTIRVISETSKKLTQQIISGGKNE